MKENLWFVSIACAAAVAAVALPGLAEARLSPRQAPGRSAYYSHGGYLIGSRAFRKIKRIQVCGILPKTVCRRYQLPMVRPLLPRLSTDKRPHKVINLGVKKKTQI